MARAHAGDDELRVGRRAHDDRHRRGTVVTRIVLVCDGIDAGAVVVGAGGVRYGDGIGNRDSRPSR